MFVSIYIHKGIVLNILAQKFLSLILNCYSDLKWIYLCGSFHLSL